MNILKLLLKSCCAAAVVMAASCNTFDESDPSSDYGYLQFKLYKSGQVPESKASSGELEYLSEAYKLQVTLKRNDSPSFVQTVLVNEVDGDNAEFGIRTEILSLVPGEYSFSGYVILDRTDKQISSGEPSSPVTISVEREKLSLCNVEVNVTKKGKVVFSLVKDFENLPEGLQTKAVDDVSYFSNIRKMTIGLQEKRLYTPVEFKNVEGRYYLDHTDKMGGSASIVSDSLLTIPAGEWLVVRVEMMDDKGMALKTLTYEVDDAPSFLVEDNGVTYFDIPVTIDAEAEYIKDYRALKRLWDELDGENWSWTPGTGTYEDNTNWNFDKDIDLWGDQPGVMLHPNGRVASLNIGTFNPVGDIPADVFEQLTELTSLYIGNHNDVVESGDLPEFSAMTYGAVSKPVYNREFNPWNYELEGSRAAFRMERNKKEMKALHRTSEKAVSEIIRFEQQRKGLAGEEPAPYAIVPYGYITNRITSIPSTIGNLKKLELLYIANSYISSIPAEIKDCQSLTDIEIYNCPKMTEFPMELAELPNLVLLNLSQNYQWSHDVLYKGLDEIFTKGNVSKTLQILYCSYNNLTTIPQSLSEVKSIGLMDFAKNELVSVPAFGQGISPVQVMLEHNHITALPDDLFNTDNLESLNISDNDLTVFPNIFTVETEFYVGDVDLSFNRIESFPADFKGIRCSGELNLSGNRLTGGFPEAFINSGSYLINVNLAWNRLTEIGAKGLHAIDEKRNLKYIQAIDYEGNRISEMPDLDELEVGVDLPFITGLSLNHNKFSEFPELWFNGWSLNTFFFDHQIDDDGNKCFSKWPDGIEQKPALRILHIAGNDLRTVRSFPIYLNYLDIMDNPNIVIEIPADIRARIENGSFELVCDLDEQEGITGLD